MLVSITIVKYFSNNGGNFCKKGVSPHLRVFEGRGPNKISGGCAPDPPTTAALGTPLVVRFIGLSRNRTKFILQWVSILLQRTSPCYF